MTSLDELIRQAQKGDIEAMQKLDAHYSERGDEAEAAKWGCLAAFSKSASLELLSVEFQEMEAAAGMQMGMWESAEETYTEIVRMLSKIQQDLMEGNIILSMEQQNELHAKLQDDMYRLALCKEAQEQDCNEILDLIKDRKDTKALVIKTLCYWRMQMFEKAFSQAELVYRDRRYMGEEKHPLEEGLYLDVLRDLAIVYRLGLPGMVSADLSRSVDILNCAYGATKDADYRRMLAEDLSHYHKKLFGGYKYI